MHKKSDLFVFHGKTHSSPSVLIINICLDSRIWPRMEPWLTSVFMTKWPSFKLRISCFSFKAENKQLNQKWSSLKRQAGTRRGREACVHFPHGFVASPSLNFSATGHHVPRRAPERPESRWGRSRWWLWTDSDLKPCSTVTEKRRCSGLFRISFLTGEMYDQSAPLWGCLWHPSSKKGEPPRDYGCSPKCRFTSAW